jgi:anti-sigma regulatory factor (Ser/Thr protein kinase)
MTTTTRASFPPALSAVRAARDWLGSVLTGRTADATVQDAQLVLVELVGNAVLHASEPPGAVIDVEVAVADDGVTLSVVDRDPASLPVVHEDPGGAGGYGLRIVHTLSRAWGVDRGHDAKRVWAVLAPT